MIAANLVSIIAPELANDPRMSVALQLAEGEVRSDHPYRERLLALIAAHVLTVANRRGSGGSVSGAGEGSLSLSFASMNDIGQLGTTSYGQEVHRLNIAAYGTAVVVV